MIVGSDEVLADQGAAILVIAGCDEVLADQGAAILVIVGQRKICVKSTNQCKLQYILQQN